MKLTTIAIDGYRQLHDLSLSEISPSLNVVYGEKGAGKTRLADFISGVLWGTTSKGLNDNEICHGQIDANHAGQLYRLTRPSSLQLNCVPVSAGVSSSLHMSPASLNARLDTIAGPLDAATFEALFNVSFSQPNTDEKRFATFLNQRMNVPVGLEATGDQSANLRITETANRLRSELDAAQAHLLDLQKQLTQCSTEITQLESNHALRIGQISSDLDRVVASINALPNSELTTSAIDTEIRSLQLRIDTAQPIYVDKPTYSRDLLVGLYAQLDEIDLQLRSWTSVKNDVQQQRIRLKDEMLLWNQMTLECESHPYHTAREILLSLESKVDHAQSQTGQWLDTHGPIDSQQAAAFVEDTCDGMRDDLYRLCDELSQQYKHIRHKSAAAELKQLRRYYEEMQEHTHRLAARRDALIADIRKHDSAGADAITRNESQFSNCARHEGFLKARQRFVGDIELQNTSRTVVAPDLTAERNRIMVLETQRAETLQQAALHLAQRNQLRVQEQLLKKELETLPASPDAIALQSRKRTIEGDVTQASERVNALQTELNSLPAAPTVMPNPLLISAAKLLDRLSGGDLVNVWIDAVHSSTFEQQAANGVEVDLQVRDRFGKVFNSAALTPSLRDVTRLSLILAGIQQLVHRGVSAPLVIDELFGAMESARVGHVLGVLSDFANLGQHQVILLTQHRFLVDRIPSAKWFDIENRTRVAQTVPASVAYVPTPATAVQSSTYDASRLTLANESNAALEVTNRHAFSSRPAAAPTHDSHTSFTQPAVTSIGADQIGDRLEYTANYTHNSQLTEIPVFDSLQLRALSDFGILDVSQFLAFEVSDLPRQWIDAGLSESVVDHLQSKIWLLTCVPGLRPSDAHVLVACGITEPDQLETSDPQTLFERIERYLDANENASGKLARISRSRISDWHRGLSRTRGTWQQRGRRNGYNNRISANRSPHDRRQYDRQSRDSMREPRDNNGPQLHKFSSESIRQQRQPREWNRDRDNLGNRAASQFDASRSPRSSETRTERPNRTSDRERTSEYRRHERDARESRDRQPRSAREQNSNHDSQSPRQDIRAPRFQGPSPDRVRQTVPAIAPLSARDAEAKPVAKRVSTISSKSKDKFYLDLDDHIEAAPSIGPKTAERFEKIGVKTINEFLKQTADSMAAGLNYKRITSEVIRNWQHQARLVCRIPNLRGHDAQILVACEMLDPEEIATMQPQELFASVGPFSSTKEGLKIIRSGKKPDLAEVSDWIAWAQKTRSIQAA